MRLPINSHTLPADVVYADFARQLERELLAAQNEVLRLSGLLRVANTERNDAVKGLADLKEQAQQKRWERDLRD